jgi:carbonic anhydrase/acetyltransferase-like protein (isoleucine patch superfamily)
MTNHLIHYYLFHFSLQKKVIHKCLRKNLKLLVSSDALVSDDVLVLRDAFVSDDAIVSTDAVVSDDAIVSSDALVSDDVLVSSDALVSVDVITFVDVIVSSATEIIMPISHFFIIVLVKRYEFN